MLSLDECRQRLGRPDMTDREIEMLLTTLDSFIDAVFNDIFSEEFEPDDV